MRDIYRLRETAREKSKENGENKKGWKTKDNKVTWEGLKDKSM